MRISSTQIFTQGIEAFNQQQSKLSILQKQISSGVRITKPSDDPVASARILELEQTVSLIEQYNSNASLAENRLRLEETTLNAIENNYYRIKELSIQANSGSNDGTSLQAIRAEIEERFDELLNLSNTQDNSGNYLFAGSRNQNEAFTLTHSGAMRHVVYNGDQAYRQFQISQTRQIRSDDNGIDIFMQVPSDFALNESTTSVTANIAPALVIDTTVYTPGDYQINFTTASDYEVVDVNGVLGPPLGSNTPGQVISTGTYSDSAPIEFAGIRTSITGTPAVGDSFSVTPGQYRDIFQTLEAFMDTLGSSSDIRNDNLSAVQKDLDTFFNNVLNTRTSIGGRLNAVETQMDDNDAFILTTQKTVGLLRDTDLAEAISQLSLEQTTLDAAQAIFARITSSSLFNFLR